jgi:uncharacterized protein
LQVSDSTGAVSAEYILPEKSKCIMTLAHGAGAGMDHTFMRIEGANHMFKAGKQGAMSF